MASEQTPAPSTPAPSGAAPSAPNATATQPAGAPELAQPDLGGYADEATRFATMRESLSALDDTPAPEGADKATPDPEPITEPPAEPGPGLEELRRDLARLAADNAELRKLLEQSRAPATPPPAEPEAAAPPARPDPLDIDGRFQRMAASELGEHAGEHLTGRYAQALQVISDWRGFDREGVDQKTRTQAKQHIDRAKAEIVRVQDLAQERERIARLEKRQEELEKRPDQAKRAQMVNEAKTAALGFLQREDSPYPSLRCALANGLDPEKILAPVDFSTIHEDDSWTDDENNPLDRHLRYLEAVLAAQPTPEPETNGAAPTPAPAAPVLLHNPAALPIPPGGTTPSHQPPGYTSHEDRLAAMRAKAARLGRGA